jgi:hypothetical protein
MSKTQLFPQQETLAAKIFHGITASIDSVAQIPNLGIGKTDIMLAASIRGGDPNETILIATPLAMVNQWSTHTHAMFPSASVFLYGVSEDGKAKYRSFTQIKPKPGLAYTFDYLTSVHDWEFKQDRMLQNALPIGLTSRFRMKTFLA